MFVLVLVFVNRIVRNRLEHIESLFQRLMAKRRPWDLGKRKFCVGHPVEQVPKQVRRPCGWSLKSTRVQGAKSVCVAASIISRASV
jgi:hypothetical protein